MGSAKMKKNDLQAIYDKVFQEAMMLTVDYDTKNCRYLYGYCLSNLQNRSGRR